MRIDSLYIEDFKNLKQFKIDLDENELNNANERIYLINGLKRKYASTIIGILEKRLYPSQ